MGADAHAAAASQRNDGTENTAATSSGTGTGTNTGNMHVVVQRCFRARLLVDSATDAWVEVGRGLVLYVSFSQGVAEGDSARLLRLVAKSLLSAPLSSSDKWKSDHSDAESVATLCRRGEAQALLVVPQASLVCKLEAGDKYVKYHQQCSKDDASGLYHGFVEALRKVARELIAGASALPKHLAANYEALREKRESAALIPPDQYFRTGEYEGRFSCFDERGVPTHDAAGAEVAKSQLKKLEKLYQGQQKKFAKRTSSSCGEVAAAAVGAAADRAELCGGDGGGVGLVAADATGPPPPSLAGGSRKTGAAVPAAPPEEATAVAAAAEEEEEEEPPMPEGACLPELRYGTFGGRQGFELVSGGPFTHTFVF